MLFSVITVSYNSQSTIRSAVDSVLAQRGVKLDYIVIDGASMDGTVDALRGYGSRIAQLVSEPDEGIYNAMNKGIGRARGEVVGILNSDDFYADDGVLAAVAKVFEDGTVDCVYGDLDYVDEADTSRVTRAWRSRPYCQGVFQKGWHPAHPTFFVRKSVYDRFGVFNDQLKIAADYEFMLRVLEKAQCKSVYLPKVMVKMRTGGASNRSISSILKANWECFQAWRLNGLGVFDGMSAILQKPARKLKQFKL